MDLFHVHIVHIIIVLIILTDRHGTPHLEGNQDSMYSSCPGNLLRQVVNSSCSTNLFLSTVL